MANEKRLFAEVRLLGLSLMGALPSDSLSAKKNTLQRLFDAPRLAEKLAPLVDDEEWDAVDKGRYGRPDGE